jgi:hypothetical protein
MAVTAKFEVQSITQHAWSGNARTVKLNAVSGDENKPWSEYTPSGSIEMQITNPAAFEQFELGKTFLLTFEEQPKK